MLVVGRRWAESFCAGGRFNQPWHCLTGVAHARDRAIACVLAAVTLAGVASDRQQRDRLATGVRIDGIDVGGKRLTAARRLLLRAASRYERTLTVQVAGRSFQLSARDTGLAVDAASPLRRALANSRQGWFGSRVARRVLAQGPREDLRLPVQYFGAALRTFTSRVARAADQAPVNVSVHPTRDGLAVDAVRPGRVFDESRLRSRLAVALPHPAGAVRIDVTRRRVAPQVSVRDLAGRYASYIIVDRWGYRLRLYDHLRLAHTYPIAVGRAGLETPAGVYDAQRKEVNPPGRVPNSSWAGPLVGKTIPPGPRDPI